MNMEYVKAPRNPDYASKEHVVAWFKVNPSRLEPVESLIALLRGFFRNDSNHGYLNKKSPNLYLFGSSNPIFGSAGVNFTKKHSTVYFWLDGPQKKLVVPEQGHRKTVKSATSTDLNLVEFKIEKDEDFDAIRNFISSNRIPGWNSSSRTYERNNFTESSNRNTNSLTAFEENFEFEVKKSLSDPQEQRQSRLNKASKMPTKITLSVDSFVRNPDVVAQILFEAKGICAKCLKTAPFNRKKNGLPYLEVHHKKQLADGGEDTIHNAEALCPNCHRERHFGETVV